MLNFEEEKKKKNIKYYSKKEELPHRLQKTSILVQMQESQHPIFFTH